MLSPYASRAPMTPFHSPAFRYLWGSSLASSAALGMERTITAWLALKLGVGPLVIGLIFAARMLPSLLFGLAAGTIADRTDRRIQLVVVSWASLLLMAGFGWLLGAGGGQTWLVVMFAFLAGCVQVFNIPARQSLVVDTVPQDAVQRALAMNALAGRLAAALGALAAGVLIPLSGLTGSYLATAMCYGLAALFVAAVHVPHDPHPLVARPPFRQALGDAARLMVEVPLVRTLLVAGLICEVFAFSHMSALPIFAQDVLAVGPEGLGTLNAALSVGGAIAVALLSLLPERVGRQPLLGTIFLVYGLVLVILSTTRSLAVAVTVLVVTGFCAGAFDVLQQTLIQMAVPAEQRGRAVGVWVLSVGSAPVGNLEMGAMVAAIGAPGGLLINGAITVIAAVTLLVRLPGYRWGRAAPHT